MGRAKPNLTPDVTPPPSQCLGECLGGFATWRKPGSARITRETEASRTGAKIRGEGGVMCGLIYLENGLMDSSQIWNGDGQCHSLHFIFRQDLSNPYGKPVASFGVLI